jgi:hypothetical protein
MRELARNFPGGAPKMNMKRLAGDADVWVAELESDYGEERGGINVCLILEFEGARIKRETRYYAEPFEGVAELESDYGEERG